MNEKERFQRIQVSGYRIQVTGFLPGLTLVELVTSIAILGVLTLMIGSVYLAHFRLFSSQSASIDTAAQNKIAIEEVSNQIRESIGVAGTCNTTNAPPGTSSTNAVLVLNLWPLVLGVPTDPGAGNPDCAVYTRNGSNNFVKSVYLSNTSTSTRKAFTNKIIASNVQTLAFTYTPASPVTDATAITVALTTQPKNSKETPFTETVKVYLRNKI